MYQRADGSPGYHLQIGRMAWNLKQGDVIWRDGERVIVDADNDGYWGRW